MPKEIDGEQYYTQEELDQMVSEKEEEIQDKMKELENASEEDKTKLQEELTGLKEENEKLKNKDHNFNNLRKNKEKKDEQVEILQNTVKTTNEKIDKILEGSRSEAKDEFYRELDIDPVHTDNKELIGKIDFYFKKVGAEAESKTQIKAALKEAYILATQSVDINDVVRQSVKTGGGRINTNNKSDVNKEKPFEAELGVTKDMKDKHGLDKRQEIF